VGILIRLLLVLTESLDFLNYLVSRVEREDGKTPSAHFSPFFEPPISADQPATAFEPAPGSPVHRSKWRLISAFLNFLWQSGHGTIMLAVCRTHNMSIRIPREERELRATATHGRARPPQSQCPSLCRLL
jgi:hypothetical protein